MRPVCAADASAGGHTAALELALVVIGVGDTAVAFEAERVLRIVGGADLDRPGEAARRIDLTELLGVDAAAEEEGHGLWLGSGRGEPVLVVGGRVWIERVPASSVQEIPALVADGSGSLALRGLVEARGRLILLADGGALAGLARPTERNP